jgi:hypothetical protein
MSVGRSEGARRPAYDPSFHRSVPIRLPHSGQTLLTLPMRSQPTLLSPASGGLS